MKNQKNIYFLDDDEIVIADPSEGEWVDETWSDKCRSVEAWHNRSEMSSDVYSIGISLYWAKMRVFPFYSQSDAENKELERL